MVERHAPVKGGRYGETRTVSADSDGNASCARRIAEARTVDELFLAIDGAGPIPNSRGEILCKDDLKAGITDYIEGRESAFGTPTRTYGILQKVNELMMREQFALRKQGMPT